jgi:hypothetical protein
MATRLSEAAASAQIFEHIGQECLTTLRPDQVTNHTVVFLSSQVQTNTTLTPSTSLSSMHIAHIIIRPSHGVQSALALTNTTDRNKGMKLTPTIWPIAKLKPRPYPHNIYLVLTIHKRAGGKDKGSLSSTKRFSAH